MTATSVAHRVSAMLTVLTLSLAWGAVVGAPAHAASPSLTLSGPESATVAEIGMPERSYLMFAVFNTGDVPLSIVEADVGCDRPFLAPEGGSECRFWVGPGQAGSQVTVELRVSATDGVTTVVATTTLTVTYADAPPALWAVAVGESPNPARVGAYVTHTLDFHSARSPWGDQQGDPDWQVAELTSHAYGDLRDPANRRVVHNTCAGQLRGPDASCSFAARLGAPNREGAVQGIYDTVQDVYDVVAVDDEGTSGTSLGVSYVTIALPTPWSARDAATWALRSTVWPRATGRWRTVSRSTRVASVFTLSRRCARALPRRLRQLLVADPTAYGVCAPAARLVKAATVAVLNEAAYGPAYPGATSVAEVVRRTNAALRGDTSHLTWLAEVFEWANAPTAPSATAPAAS